MSTICPPSIVLTFVRAIPIANTVKRVCFDQLSLASLARCRSFLTHASFLLDRVWNWILLRSHFVLWANKYLPVWPCRRRLTELSWKFWKFKPTPQEGFPRWGAYVVSKFCPMNMSTATMIAQYPGCHDSLPALWLGRREDVGKTHLGVNMSTNDLSGTVPSIKTSLLMFILTGNSSKHSVHVQSFFTNSKHTKHRTPSRCFQHF